jgi:hypothetical protein
MQVGGTSTHSHTNSSTVHIHTQTAVQCTITHKQQYCTHSHTNNSTVHNHTQTAVQYTITHKQQYSTHSHTNNNTVHILHTNSSTVHIHTQTAVQYTFTHKQYTEQHNDTKKITKILILVYKNVPLCKIIVIHCWSRYVNWKHTCSMFTETFSKSGWVSYVFWVLRVSLFWLQPGLFTLSTTLQLEIMTLQFSTLWPLSHWPVSILLNVLYIYIVHSAVFLITSELNTVKQNT